MFNLWQTDRAGSLYRPCPAPCCYSIYCCDSFPHPLVGHYPICWVVLFNSRVGRLNSHSYLPTHQNIPNLIYWTHCIVYLICGPNILHGHPDVLFPLLLASVPTDYLPLSSPFCSPTPDPLLCSYPSCAHRRTPTGIPFLIPVLALPDRSVQTCLVVR